MRKLNKKQQAILDKEKMVLTEREKEIINIALSRLVDYYGLPDLAKELYEVEDLIEKLKIKDEHD